MEIKWGFADDGSSRPTACQPTGARICDPQHRESATGLKIILPAVEGGFQPPGKKPRHAEDAEITVTFAMSRLVPPGWKPGSTSAKMADATFFKPALTSQNNRDAAGLPWSLRFTDPRSASVKVIIPK